jgi:hypothetical protein
MGLMVREVPILDVENEAERGSKTRQHSAARGKVFKAEPKWMDERKMGGQNWLVGALKKPGGGFSAQVA